MVTAPNLFFDGMLIGKAEAPQRILDSEEHAFNYWAIVKKRFGNISGSDYLKCARRFSTLCDEIYLGSKFDLCLNKVVPLGYAVALASRCEWRGMPGEKLEISGLMDESFQKIFADSYSMELTIKPTVERNDIWCAFSQITWTRDRPKTIFLYAQGGGKHDQEGKCQSGPFHNLLLRKMFFVPGSAPSLNFKVKLGIEAKMKEAEGKLF